jgi:hypothetical protein
VQANLAVVIELSWIGLFICARNSGRVLAGRSLLASASNSRYYHSQLQLLKARADVDYVDINYRGASQAIIAT